MIEAYALTGVIIRGSNLKKDLRLLGYELYALLSWGVPTATTGDWLDRYLIRMNECLESVKIIQQCIKSLKVFIILYNYKKINTSF